MFAASKSGSVDAKDPQFNYVTMLLHGNGTNGAQNNTFIDSSTNNFTITRNGNTTQGTFTPYGSNWSNYFNGSPYLSTPTASGFQFGTGDFTVEMWAFANSSSTQHGLVASNTSGVGYWASLIFGNLIYWQSQNGTTNLFSVDYTSYYNKWTHIAYVRSSGTTKLYLNGVQVASAADTTNYTMSAGNVDIGRDLDNSALMNGYLSNVRIVKGTAVYTSAFTPSTTPLTAISGTSLLTCQSNRFVDNSSNAFALTVSGSPSVQRFSPFSPTTAYSTSVIGGSGYFDGSGDYLSVASQTALGMGAGDFTYEAWIYVNEIVPTNALRGLYDSRVAGATGCGIYTSADSGTTSKLVYATNSAIAASSTNTIKAYAWTHVAVTRSGTTVRGFLNGALEFTYTDSRTFSSSAGTYIGADVTPAYFNGFINDARILKGTAQYTSAFTPPTAPLTAITNTSLLLNYTNAGILDNAMMNDLETVGNAQISTSVKKYGTGSMYFDGAGDYLYEPSTPNLTLGSGDFTVEMWVNPSSISGTLTFLLGMRPATTNGAYPVLYADNTGTYWYVSSANRISGSVLSTSTWTHLAIARSGTSTKMFINGTQTGSTYTDSTNYLMGRLYIGASDYNSGSSEYLTGYIDDLRITKGVARYTANFSVPTAAFPDKG